MKPKQVSRRLLTTTRAKAKMVEYSVPQSAQARIRRNPAELFVLTIGLLGKFADQICRGTASAQVGENPPPELVFANSFFDQYMKSRLNTNLDPYVALIGSASHYLCGFPGSAAVLAGEISGECPDLEGGGLEQLLLWLLRGPASNFPSVTKGPYRKRINELGKMGYEFTQNGTDGLKWVEKANAFRESVVVRGTSRQVFLATVVVAVIKRKYENSVWIALPKYSGIGVQEWTSALEKDSPIKELWPAQHILGAAQVMSGLSAIVQMPTSAGKTRAMEMIIRSAFLSKRARFVVIVSPFRALCQETMNTLGKAFINEDVKIDALSDALQVDYKIDYSAYSITAHSIEKRIVVMTPEKLIYVLRHDPIIQQVIDVMILDEGHLFDDGVRGVTYELLLTTLREFIPTRAQKLLLSAVLTGAELVGEWLNQYPLTIGEGKLRPTVRNVGFVNWEEETGTVMYVKEYDISEDDFAISGVIESRVLPELGTKRTEYEFPSKDDNKSIALYLGLRLVRNGGVAIFCGTKLIAKATCRLAHDVLEIGEVTIHYEDLTNPLQVCGSVSEAERLAKLYEANLGIEAVSAQSARNGVFAHHGNTPDGIRLAVEHAMRKGDARFVVCTSTLAQGVNLPFRYLLIPGVYYGKEEMKPQDLQNLMGRVARGGMYTEGSVLFTDPNVYRSKGVRGEMWQWQRASRLLAPADDEVCTSSILELMKGLEFEGTTKDKIRRKRVLRITIDQVVDAHEQGRQAVISMARDIENAFDKEDLTVSGVEKILMDASLMLSSIEGYLMFSSDSELVNLDSAGVLELLGRTLAYYVADPETKDRLQRVFVRLAQNVNTTVLEPRRRAVFGKLLYGIWDAIDIEAWMQEHALELVSLSSGEEALTVMWELMCRHIHQSTFKAFRIGNLEDLVEMKSASQVLLEIAQMWIQGRPFFELETVVKKRDCRIGKSKNARKVDVDDIVDICGNAFAYDGSLLVGGMCDVIELIDNGELGHLAERLSLFQKKIKYGLPSKTAVVLYECGLSDRVLAQELAAVLGETHSLSRKEDLPIVLQNDVLREQFSEVLAKYPQYFREVITVDIET